MNIKPFLLATVLLGLAATAQAGDTLLISEFMASNTRTLADEDGEYSDWIEIHNPGAATVDLLDWCLTDEADNLTKWRFPSTNLPPGRFLVVFASNKNRRMPGAPLHTNFKLAAEGEYLALVHPDGVTIAAQFAPQYPPQSADISYGFAAVGTTVTLVPTGAVARAWVPRDGSLGTNWTLPGFNDSGWLSGTTAVGYERTSGYQSLLGLDLLSAAYPAALRMDSDGDGFSDNTSVYVRLPFVLPDPPNFNALDLRMRHDDGFAAYLNGQPVAADNEPPVLAWNSAAAGDYGDVTDVMLAIAYGADGSIAIYRNGQVYADAAHATKGTLQTYPAGVADVLIGKRHDDLGDGGTPAGFDGFLAGSVNEARIYGAALSAADVLTLYTQGPTPGAGLPPPPAQNNLLHLWSFNDGTARDAAGTAHGTLLNGAAVQGGRLALDGIDDYMRSAPISTNLGARTLIVWVSLANLSQQGGSALTLENPTGTDAFDGIIYGESIPRQWINGSCFWLRTVADNGGPSETVVETPMAGIVAFDISSHADQLLPGTNVLAIHGLNASLSDPDMLILPELVGGAFALQTNQDGYFDRPTPSAMNRDVYQRLFASLDFSAERGFYTGPFSLSVTSDTPGVTLRYTLDGSAPSETNGAVYAAPLPISRTTIVRAAAFKAGLAPTETATRTYVFIADVLRQTNSAPAGAHWDTEMDPQVVTNSSQTWAVAQGLADLPTLSVVMDNADLFGPNGIYSNPTARGDDWERAASAELFYPAQYGGYRADQGFAVNCGIQINGNFSRLSHQPKHSFRLVFKDRWGPTKLQCPLYPEYEVTEFNTLVVTCGHNQGWSTGIANSQFLRNRFCWDMEGVAPGSAFVHNVSVHLYLNGLYWGIYDLCERPDDAFAASNFGGDREEYDTFKGLEAGGSHNATLINGVRDAWTQLFALADTDLTNPANYAAIQQLVDVDQLINYYIEILYAADRDGPTGWINGPPNSEEPKNFYASRRRTADGRFRFWCWDSEFTLESEGEDVSERRGYENPARLHYNLRVNPEYRLRFADRVQQFFFNNGPFTIPALTNRYLALAAQIDKALVTESARWGDSKREPPFTRDVEWVAERNRIVSSYFPNRQAIFLNQLRADGLFPSFAAPALRLNGAPQYGGPMTAGSLLSLTATNGQIYYTLDGSDPRLAGGAIAPGALLYTNALTLPDSVVVKARVLSGGQWSALSEATFFVPQDYSKLLVTEIMYNPPPWAGTNGDELEFLELKNTGTTTLALEGLSFSAGINFRFPAGVLLGPGRLLVLARHAAQFQAKYPGVSVAGEYSGQLDDGSETIRLSHPTLGTVLELTYGDAAPWPATPDGHGFSLVPRNPDANPDPDDSANWRASALPGGSPGADDPPSLIPAIKVNEALTASPPPQVDAIELFNPTTNSLDLGGWFLTDDPKVPRKYRIPDGSLVGAGGFLVFDETQFNAAPADTNDFALSSSGERVHLFSADPAGNLTGYDHGFAFGAAREGVAFGRHVISTGREDFPAQLAFTPWTTNAGPLVGPVAISEIMYHPTVGGDEFVEIQNITAAPVALYDPLYSANTWRLNGLGYSFPAGLQLAAGERLVLVPGDPELFRSKYGLPVNALVLGPWAGTLQNSGERLQLQMPGVPDAQGVPFITVDEVRYNDRAPWPEAADGFGPSLQRIQLAAYGNEPTNWTAALPSPGAGLAGAGAPLVLVQPHTQQAGLGQSATFAVSASGLAPLQYQWSFNDQWIAGATNATLIVTNVNPALAGHYRVLVFNPAGYTVSAAAQLLVSAQGAIVINEILFNPITPGAQYVELFNTSTNYAYDLSGWRFDGLSYVFPVGTVMGPRSFLVLARDRAACLAAYGAIPIFDVFPITLSAQGGTLALIQPGPTMDLDLVIDQVRYETTAPWADWGHELGGIPLQLIDANQDNSRLCNWSYGPGWRFASHTGAPGASTLYLNLDTPGEVYLDDLSLVPGAVAGVGSNYIRNGDFEKALTNGWRAIGTATNSSISTDLVHAGSGSLHLVVSNPAGTSAKLQQIISGLTPANTYTLSFWYLPVGASNGLTAWLSGGFMPRTVLQAPAATPGVANGLAAALPAIPPVWINEVQPINTGTLPTPAGQYQPWVELFNAGASPVNLAGLWLADNYTNLAQWAFPAGASIPAGGFRIIWADGQTNLCTPDELHAGFRLSAAGGSVALSWLQGGQPAVLDYLNYAAMPPDYGYGSWPEGQPFARQFMPHSTPGGMNDAAPPPLVVTAAVSDGQCLLHFPTLPGCTYRAEYQDALAPANWTALDQQVAAGFTLTMTNELGAQPQRFYRVVRVD